MVNMAERLEAVESVPSVACVLDECWRLVCAASSWSTERTRNGSVQKAGAVRLTDARLPDSAPENLPPSIVRRATSQRGSGAGQNHLQAGKMGGPGKSAGAGKAAGDALGAKGSKEPKKAPRSRPTAAEKDEQKLNDLHVAAKGDWLKAQWKAYAELQKKVADRKEKDALEPTFPAVEGEIPGEKPGAAIPGAAKSVAAKSVAANQGASNQGAANQDAANPGAAKQQRKLEPPKCRFDGTGDYETFRRQVLIWRNKYLECSYSEQEIGAELCEVLSDEAIGAVFAIVDEGAEAVSIVIEALDARFGRKAMPKATSAVEALASFTRGKLSLRQFLNKYTELRAKAQRAGEIMCPNTSGTKLLKAAELDGPIHAQLLATIAASGKPGSMVKNMPSYEAALEQLEILAEVYESQNEAKQSSKAFLASKLEEEPKGKGKSGSWQSNGFQGKGGSWQGSGWKDNGGKSGGKAKGGKAKGGKSGGKSGKGGGKAGKGTTSKGKGKGKGKQLGLCWYIEKGETCPYGDACKFSHDKGGAAGTKRHMEDGAGPRRKGPRTEPN